jgi:hypothetical protein
MQNAFRKSAWADLSSALLRDLTANDICISAAAFISWHMNPGTSETTHLIFYPQTPSFAALATRNLMTVLAGILIFCCVLGLKPLRAFLFCFTSLPNPGTRAYPKGYGLAAVIGLTETHLSQIVSEINRPESPRGSQPRGLRVASQGSGVAD